ncbi:MAG: sigma-54-dependent Fis family transcriptional regulator [Desulfuromonas sp.]|nr:MAG: sigma-54-dependent Fis family transcriptional regulator [Desulfuromonas sp.]
MSTRNLLIVDENRDERLRAAEALRERVGCVVLEADTVAEATEMLATHEVAVLVTPPFLPGRDGFELVRRAHADNPQIVAIAAIPEQERKLATEALQIGVFFHIQTPYDLSELVITVARGLRHHELQIYHREEPGKTRRSSGFQGIIGESSPMRHLFDLIERIAVEGNSTVLIQGESGTGKELVARAIHVMSPRHGGNFVPVNCAAIPEELLESELFGYVKGAFTGATQAKAGRIRYADGGTLFLDEIGDMKPALQAKLLRVLQEREFEPVGGLKPVPVDVRIVAATHRDLEKLIAEGTFREDLYYRLSVIPLLVPPLRSRRDDIPLLTQEFIRILARNRKVALKGFDDDAIRVLKQYAWPGNVRELENLVQRLLILHDSEMVSPQDLPERYRRSDGGAAKSIAEGDVLPWSDSGVDFNSLVSAFESRLIIKALQVAEGNKKEAARLLNLNRTTLLEKIKKKQL